MTKLLKVAEAILDSAASEYLEINMASPKAVEDYAFNGMDIALTDDEAKLIHSTIVNYKNNGEFGSSNDYYYMLEKPLLGDEATL